MRNRSIWLVCVAFVGALAQAQCHCVNDVDKKLSYSNEPFSDACVPGYHWHCVDPVKLEEGECRCTNGRPECMEHGAIITHLDRGSCGTGMLHRSLDPVEGDRIITEDGTVIITHHLWRLCGNRRGCEQPAPLECAIAMTTTACTACVIAPPVVCWPNVDWPVDVPAVLEYEMLSNAHMHTQSDWVSVDRAMCFDKKLPNGPETIWTGEVCIAHLGTPHWTCADKSRILVTAEDGTKHCLKFSNEVKPRNHYEYQDSH